MIRLNRLLRVNNIKKAVGSARAGAPGWDRPDVPPTTSVPRRTKFSDQQLVFNFFHDSAPEFFITEVEVYEGTLLEALPTFTKYWGAFLAVALSLGLFVNLITPLRKSTTMDPIDARYIIQHCESINDNKTPLKTIKENPVGIKINTEQFPHESDGKFIYFPLYYRAKDFMRQYESIQSQSQQYLQKALERANLPKAHH